jgi:Alpha/beta hydrolase of unknown function (DUF900)
MNNPPNSPPNNPRNNQLLSVYPLGPEGSINFPAYFVCSTAPINVEELNPSSGDAGLKDYIREIVDGLKHHADDAEILVMIHGYNTDVGGTEYWCRKTCEYISEHYPNKPKGLIVLGYRWPSEKSFTDDQGKPSWKPAIAAQAALPKAIWYLAMGALACAIVSLLGDLTSLAVLFSTMGAFKLGVIISVLLSGIFLIAALVALIPILTLVGLRLSNYFRDTFRANNYGVADLVELIRQLDNALVESAEPKARADKEAYWHPRRVKLSFIGHSMGAFVVTNTVRVISDVFDKDSIGNLHSQTSARQTTSRVGNTFALSKLVLVAPDISSEAIISGRANVLRASLRRFDEAYLFCNEGDMALRLASTTANYFTYPAGTREGGYRLGNVTVRDSGQRAPSAAPPSLNALVEHYGVVNQTQDGRLVADRSFLSYLFIRRTQSLESRQHDITGLAKTKQSIAELFTYFDCTNYAETVCLPNQQRPDQPRMVRRGIVSRALGKVSLNFWDYCALVWDFSKGRIDPHGGYIFCGDAVFSKRAIYGLGCLGFEGFLDTMKSEGSYASTLAVIQQSRPDLVNDHQVERTAQLRVLSGLCADRGIQVLLAPERYQVNIMQGTVDRTQY